MNDTAKTKEQLIQELENPRQRIADLEKGKNEGNLPKRAFDPQWKTFYEIFQNDPHGIVQIDKKGTYLYVNPQFTEITGYSLQDVPSGREWFQKAFPDPAYRQKVLEAWKSDSSKLGRGKDLEFKITCRDGSTKYIEFRTTFLKNYYFTVLTDVTQRKRSEIALQESERRLASLIDFFPDPILAINKDKRVTIWNRTIEELTGRQAQEMIEKGDHLYTVPFYGYPRPQLMDLFWEPKHGTTSKYPSLRWEGENLVAEAFVLPCMEAKEPISGPRPPPSGTPRAVLSVRSNASGISRINERLR